MQKRPIAPTRRLLIIYDSFSVTKAHVCETEKRSPSPLYFSQPCFASKLHQLIDNLINRAEVIYIADIERFTSKPSTLPSAALLAIGQA
jgi:hypothetical protein